MNHTKIKELEEFIKTNRLPFTLNISKDKINITVKNGVPITEPFIDRIEQLGYKINGMVSLNQSDFLLILREFDFP
jgi:hypothetical protein